MDDRARLWNHRSRGRAFWNAFLVVGWLGGCSPQCNVPAGDRGDAGACLGCGAGTVPVCYKQCLPVRGEGERCVVDVCSEGPAGAGICGNGLTDAGAHKPLACVAFDGSNVGVCTNANGNVVGQLGTGCDPNSHPCEQGTYCITASCNYGTPSNPVMLDHACLVGRAEGAACDYGACLPCEAGLTCVGATATTQGVCHRPCQVASCQCANELCLPFDGADSGVCCSNAMNAVCHGACTNTGTDVNNCGGCGTACAVPASATVACAAGHCGIGACNPGFADCDRDPTDGCEVDTATDSSNCGGCGIQVPTRQHAIVGCRGGAPFISSCISPYADCDGNESNGCEVNLRTDVHNCLRCGTTCRTGPSGSVASHGAPTCADGLCSLACASGFADCNHRSTDGCEADLSQAGHCGRCGTVCSGATPICVEGNCVRENGCGTDGVVCPSTGCCGGLFCDSQGYCVCTALGSACTSDGECCLGLSCGLTGGTNTGRICTYCAALNGECSVAEPCCDARQRCMLGGDGSGTFQCQYVASNACAVSGTVCSYPDGMNNVECCGADGAPGTPCPSSNVCP